MDWGHLFIVLLVSHLVGDFILQTEWQATNKGAGLGRDPEARRALRMHLVTYALPFLPALVWTGSQDGAAAAVVLAVVALLPHYVQDDGRLLRSYVTTVKKVEPPQGSFLWIAVDQSFHVVALLGAALLVGLAL